jgi:signal peptidase II
VRDVQAAGGAALSGDRPAPRRRAVALLGLAAVLVVLADQVTKHVALRALDADHPVRLLGGAVYLTLTRNSGAAFSMGRGYTMVFPLIAAVVVGWIGWLGRRLRSVPWGVALGLVLGGALGNMVDRVFRAPGVLRGHVVDMVSLFDPGGQAWPVFNLADSSLVAGVTLAVALEMFGYQRDGSRAQRKAATEQAATQATATQKTATRKTATQKTATRKTATQKTGRPAAETIEG